MSAAPKSSPLMNYQAVAGHIGLSRRQIGRYIKAGDLKIVRIGGRVLFRPEDIDAFIGQRSDDAPVAKKRGKGAR